MTDKTREAFEAIVGETDLDLYIDETEEYYSGRTLRAFGKYCEDIVAATAEADAKYLPVVEKLVEALKECESWREGTDSHKRALFLRDEALALAKPLLEKRGEV